MPITPNSLFSKKWFHDDLLIKLTPEEIESEENSILYTVTWALRYHKWILYQVGRFVMRDGQIFGPRSHDNMTAIITYLAKYDCMNAVKNIRILPNFIHPRDAIYIAYVQGRIWSYPLLPILFLIFLNMAVKEFKYRPTPWNWIMQGFPKRFKIRKTDTEILYWIRLHLPQRYKFIHWTRGFIVPILRWKYGADWEQGMFDLFYRHPEHPNRTYKLNIEEMLL